MMRYEREIGQKGQVVIPKHIREMLKLRKGNKVVFEIENKEVKIKPERDPVELVRDFLNTPKLKRRITLKDLKKIEDESYDLP